MYCTCNVILMPLITTIAAVENQLVLHFLIYTCNETNLMHYLSSVYSVTIPLHVSGLLVAHHQEVAMYICDNWYVLYVLVDCRLAWMAL
jgi:hypothetical protein